METALLKLARQLDGLDEASLMNLWEKYQAIVEDFHPSREWEEAVLVLGMIQSVRWKNQLFNYHWADQTRTDPPRKESPESGNGSGPSGGDGVKERGKVLRFRPPQKD